MHFAKRVFLVAGVLGIPLVFPTYFLEGRSAEMDPPPINHPEFFYGLTSVVLVWQLVYLMIGTDPVRYRPMMLLAALAKGGFVLTILALFVAGRVRPFWLAFTSFDGVFTVLFLLAYAWTPAVWAATDPGARAEERERVGV
jgi:hypothetical protein